jgi:hypothetical protein
MYDVILAAVNKLSALAELEPVTGIKAPATICL